MPRSAIATGIVDLVLPPEKMPEALVGISRHAYVRQPTAAIKEPEADAQLGTLLTFIRSQTRQDFSAYRKETVLRRILRRMGLHRIDSLSGYIERLQTDDDEIAALARDLTINVSGFFRDPEAWEVTRPGGHSTTGTGAARELVDPDLGARLLNRRGSPAILADRPDQLS
jgi:two-component system CheB/CheR fusion protein